MTITLHESHSPEDYARLAETLEQVAFDLEVLEESYSMLELAREDQGWQQIGMQGERKFTRQGLRDAARLARVMLVANPLLKRGVQLRIAYVWAQGVQIQARANGKSEANPNEQDVNTVVQGFLDAPETLKVLTGAAARARNERSLATDGALHVTLVTDPLTGTVRPRLLPYDEIDQVIYSPEDRLERRFYLRQFTQIVTEPGVSGGFRQRSETRRILYPAVDYRPASRPSTVAGLPVEWNSPVVELNVNDLEDWDFGIGDTYAAIPWARAYAEFLTDWAKLVKALSRFAFRASADRKTKAQQAASKQYAAESRSAAAVDGTGLPGPRSSNAGATVHTGPGQTFEAIPKTGATIDSESGRPLAGMIAAGLEVSVVALLADPGVTGARATAETLDKPTEDMANLRREAHAEFLTRILDYVVDMAAKAPQGPLKRKSMTRDKVTGREVIILAGDTDRTIEIVWPDLTQESLTDLVSAIKTADDTGKMPPVETLKQLLRAFNIRDVDEIIDTFTDADGNWIDPDASAGDEAVRRFRNGEDPAGDL